MNNSRKKDIEDYLEAVESQQRLLGSTPLTDGGEFPWSQQMVDQQLFLQNQIVITEEELENLIEDDNLHFPSQSASQRLKAIIPKGQEYTDRTYVLGLCDEILGEVSLRQYTYEFVDNFELKRVNVDAYYMGQNLIVVYENSSRRKPLPTDGTRIIVISYKDFGTSRKIRRDKDKSIVTQLLKSFHHDRKYSSKRSEFLRLNLYFRHVISEFCFFLQH